MKTFEDLEFEAHPVIPRFDTIAKLMFDNGYGVSVITGEGAYTNSANPYEVGVLDNAGSLDYTTPITDDVIGYCNESKVTEIMKQIQQLPSLK